MDKQYQIYKYLDEEKRIVGLTIDEFVPIVLVLILSFLMKFLLIGVFIGVSVFSAMRAIKKNRGRCALLSLIYWNGNDLVGQTLFRSFPPSSQRYWV